MLVVDGVELSPPDQLEDVRHLDAHRAAWRQHRGQPGGEVVQVGHVRQHVVRHHQVRLAVLAHQRPRQLGTEELRQGRHTLLLGRRRDVPGRVDAEHADAARHEVAQQVAVVRRHLDDERGRAQALSLGSGRAETRRMIEPTGRVGREVRVLAEDLLGCREVFGLHQEALVADVGAQRVEGLRLVQAVVVEVALAQRLCAQVDEDAREWGAAEPASGSTRAGCRGHVLLWKITRRQVGDTAVSTSVPVPVASRGDNRHPS